jgi:outer membrane protein OmpA-like peptidoglycan-associated protein
MADFLKPRASEQEENHWLSVSDLMAGLMVVFLFIAIALMRNAMIERDRIKEVAVAYQETQIDIYNALTAEFAEDLERWNADVDRDTLTFTFNSPDILFQTGAIDLNPAYQELLSDFFPRYLNVLEHYKDNINEVRIEGHTSSVWNRFATPSEAYFLNMELSQGRTRSVLEYVYGLEEVAGHQHWIKANIAAVGFSSAKPVDSDGVPVTDQTQEDSERSRRVTFRVISNADIRIKQILELGE